MIQRSVHSKRNSTAKKESRRTANALFQPLNDQVEAAAVMAVAEADAEVEAVEAVEEDEADAGAVDAAEAEAHKAAASRTKNGTRSCNANRSVRRKRKTRLPPHARDTCQAQARNKRVTMKPRAAPRAA